jgi:hypothetical protein
MQNFTLTITISADGETVEGQISGMQGKKCSNIAALLDKVGNELDHRHTVDYDRPEPVSIATRTSRTVSSGRRC